LSAEKAICSKERKNALIDTDLIKVLLAQAKTKQVAKLILEELGVNKDTGILPIFQFLAKVQAPPKTALANESMPTEKMKPRCSGCSKASFTQTTLINCELLHINLNDFKTSI
jgi:hypothetical protein